MSKVKDKPGKSKPKKDKGKGDKGKGEKSRKGEKKPDKKSGKKAEDQGKKRRKKPEGAAKSKRPPIAVSADKYTYYQRAVQVPEEDVKFFRRVYRGEFGEDPRVFREDFCGTALCCCKWVESHPENQAFGVDLDPEPLAWGTRENLSQLNDAQRERVKLIEGNALDGGTPAADVLSALNFSFFCFKERTALLEYFRKAYGNLKEDGIFAIDMEGGWEALDESFEEREEDGFTYEWEQLRFCAITHEAHCAIHFEFEDGSRIERAFEYDWRIWTMPEIRDLLIEAGFKRADVYWEGWDEEEEEGDGNFSLTHHAENCESWIAYVVGVK